MALTRQPVTINGIEFDALISSDHTLEATVPEYAVEKGFCVGDAIILNPEKLNMVLYVTDTPVTWYSRHGTGRTASVVQQLKELYYTAEPVTIVTGDAVYTDMAVESITVSKSAEAGRAREIPISFKKIRITYARTTTIPDSYGKSGQTMAAAGTAGVSSEQSNGDSAESAGRDSKSSILYSAAKSFGILK